MNTQHEIIHVGVRHRDSYSCYVSHKIDVLIIRDAEIKILRAARCGIKKVIIDCDNSQLQNIDLSHNEIEDISFIDKLEATPRINLHICLNHNRIKNINLDAKIGKYIMNINLQRNEIESHAPLTFYSFHILSIDGDTKRILNVLRSRAKILYSDLVVPDNGVQTSLCSIMCPVLYYTNDPLVDRTQFYRCFCGSVRHIDVDCIDCTGGFDTVKNLESQ